MDIARTKLEFFKKMYNSDGSKKQELLDEEESYLLSTLRSSPTEDLKWEKLATTSSKKKIPDFTLQEYLPTKSRPSSSFKRITPANYDAIEIHGYFGLIYDGIGSFSEHSVIVHTCNRLDKQHMLGLQPGDDIHVVFLRARKKGVLNVRYITRSQYFSPGVPITSVCIGVDHWECERLNSSAQGSP